MAEKSKTNKEENVPFFALPAVGTTLTAASGVSFLVLGMILPLVGRAAAVTPYYGKNKAVFLSVVLLSLILAGLATFSKLSRRKIDNSPLPMFSFLLCGVSLFLLVAFLAGLLAI